MKKRINKRIRSCNGCSININVDPLIPPHDLVFAKKEWRTKRGRRRDSTNTDDKVLTIVHYHVKKACVEMHISKDIVLNNIHRQYLKKQGFKIQL